MEEQYEITPSVNFMHWSVGVKVEIPRKTKHNYHLWILKLRFLCFAIQIARRNEQRVAKTKEKIDV